MRGRVLLRAQERQLVRQRCTSCAPAVFLGNFPKLYIVYDDTLPTSFFANISNSQSSEPVDYGTSPDTKITNFEDYDWEQDRMITYRMNDKGNIKLKVYDS